MTNRLTAAVVQGVRDARAEVLGIDHDELTGGAITAWLSQRQPTFERAQTLCSVLLVHEINERMRGWWTETDHALMHDARIRLVELFDSTLVNLDRSVAVRPVDKELVLQVQDTKLSSLLREFNAVRETAPNVGAIAARTIISLI